MIQQRAQTSARILVVADEPTIRRGTEDVLRSAGYDVISAGTGEECFRLSAAAHPDLILLDLLLPDAGAVEITRQLKANALLEDIFIVLISDRPASSGEPDDQTDAGADGYLARPFETRELVAWVRTFLRHKAAADALRESNNRYRQLFDHNPQPMWIFNRASLAILAANHAAATLYGYTPDECLCLSMINLFAEGQLARFLSLADGADAERELRSQAWQHRRKGGSAMDVEIACHDLQWGWHPVRVMMITDVTERRQVEMERERQRTVYDTEINTLERLADIGALPLTTQAMGLGPLRKVAPEAFQQLIGVYRAILETALEERIYKQEPRTSRELRDLAEQLFFLRAGPRDVIELHFHALKQAMADRLPPKAQGYLETGRMTIVELMGNLVAVYRLNCLSAAPDASRKCEPDQKPAIRDVTT